LLDGAHRCRGPVADALRFVQGDQVRSQFLHVADIFEYQLITHEVEECRSRMHGLAARE
jgi:hypothetical protein